MVQRRSFLAATAGGFAWSWPVAKAQKPKSIIVIGAGVAGLGAAVQLAAAGHQVTVLEARDRVGGRVVTDRKELGFPCDTGAGWIHGPDGGNPVTELASKANSKTYLTKDDSVRVFDSTGQDVSKEQFGSRGDGKFKALLAKVESWGEEHAGSDQSLFDVIRQFDAGALADPYIQYPLTAYVEFDAGGPLEKLSALHWAGDEKFPGDDVIFPAGYDAIPLWLAQQAKQAGVQILLGTQVVRVDHSASAVSVVTDKGVFNGQAAVCTLPLGVLKSGKVTFQPALPSAQQASIARIGVGSVNKVFCSFDKPFWPEDVQYFGYHAPQRGLMAYWLNYRTFSDINCLVGICMGNAGFTVEALSDAQVKAEATKALRTMFGAKAQEPKAILCTRWSADPLALGAYSFNAKGASSADFSQLAKPVSSSLILAGEHTSEKYRATVHGAYLSGLRAAKLVSEL